MHEYRARGWEEGHKAKDRNMIDDVVAVNERIESSQYEKTQLEHLLCIEFTSSSQINSKIEQECFEMTWAKLRNCGFVTRIGFRYEREKKGCG